ncbi:MAG: hypothetical protein QOG78_2664 [Rhodospirillaceae bacterium]|jgi:hypothetical protein|nr:hypothetical protein [Rhodospirillaceae bacterium]MEA2809588.1 hypothetical protein [Rhodospirillaceae bacterium]MEA2847383.1 hypothetical protein [Rhodospirillaceae bacterium]
MADDFGGNWQEDTEAASSMLAFAAFVVPAPSSGDCTGDDEPDDFDRNVATIAAHIARLGLSLPTLGRIACDLQQSADVAWGKLAGELREEFPDLSDLHFAGVVLTTVEAIRELALTMPARTHVDSSARLKIFARGLGVVPERRETIRALLVHDIEALLGEQKPTYPSPFTPGDAGDRDAAESRQDSIAATLARTIPAG